MCTHGGEGGDQWAWSSGMVIPSWCVASAALDRVGGSPLGPAAAPEAEKRDVWWPVWETCESPATELGRNGQGVRAKRKAVRPGWDFSCVFHLPPNQEGKKVEAACNIPPTYWLNSRTLVSGV